VRRSASAVLAAALVAALPAGAAVPSVDPPAGAELEALARPPAHSALASQRIYFVMPDRYANGDPSNDRGGLTGARSVTGFDPTDEGWFHGGDYRGLTGNCSDSGRGLARLKDLGFTAIWVTPPYRQKFVQGSSAAYHGYWIVDFTTVDPHLGSEQDFAAFVECAHGLGLKVYLDVVVNHTADVVLLPAGYSDAPYRDCRGRRFDPARYTAGTRFPCLRPAGMPRVPLVPAAERAAKRPAWLNDVRRYHNRGDIDFESCSEVCFEQGDFFGLDDLFTEQPAVVAGLAEAYASWIRRFKVDGFRVDTARHVNAAFFRLWVPRILAAARKAGVADFQIFGEAFLTDAIALAPFVRDRGLPNVLDFPLQDALTRFAGGSAGARGMAARLDDDDYFQTAAGVAHTPPTFLGNHDVGHAALKIREQAGSDDALLERVLLAHSALYLLRGAPVAYYGDEVGIVGRGGDKQARQDLFPTEVREWQTAERLGAPPIGTGSSFDREDGPIALHLRTLGALRDAHPALSTGATVVRGAEGGRLAVSRIDADAKREFVAAFNSGTAAARLTFPTATPGATWTPLLGTDARPRSGAGGALTLELPPLTAVLLRADSDLPTRAPVTPRLRVGPDGLSDMWRLFAGVPPAGSTLAFAVKRGSGTWRRIGVDDSPPYRAFLDPRRYRSGERVQLVAIVRSLDGRTAVSPVVPFVVKGVSA
jgi:glycosidase